MFVCLCVLVFKGAFLSCMCVLICVCVSVCMYVCV